MTAVEKEEWNRRGWSVAWWGMRGAFYENVTRYSQVQLHSRRNELIFISIRAWIQAFTGRMKGKPLLDIVGGVVEDYEYLWNEYYFSTATM